MPEISGTINLQLEPDTPNVSRPIPDADIPEIARKQLQELLNVKYNSIVSKSATDMGKTNLIELNTLTEGPPVASKPYTVPLKYREFVDCEIKQLEKEGIISRSMSDWASTILVPKKEERVENSRNQNTAATTKKNKCNYRLCIDYRKLQQLHPDSKIKKMVV